MKKKTYTSGSDGSLGFAVPEERKTREGVSDEVGQVALASARSKANALKESLYIVQAHDGLDDFIQRARSGKVDEMPDWLLEDISRAVDEMKPPLRGRLQVALNALDRASDAKQLLRAAQLAQQILLATAGTRFMRSARSKAKDLLGNRRFEEITPGGTFFAASVASADVKGIREDVAREISSVLDDLHSIQDSGQLSDTATLFRHAQRVRQIASQVVPMGRPGDAHWEYVQSGLTKANQFLMKGAQLLKKTGFPGGPQYQYAYLDHAIHGLGQARGALVRKQSKSMKSDELAYLLLELAQAADSHHLMAVSRALADLRGTPIDEEMDTALRALYKDASAAREAKDWKKVSRSAWGLVDGYIKKSVKSATKGRNERFYYMLESALQLMSDAANDKALLRASQTLANVKRFLRPGELSALALGYLDNAIYDLNDARNLHPKLRSGPLTQAAQKIRRVHAAVGDVPGKSTKALKLAPGMKVFLKAENCYGEVKEMDENFCKVELLGEDGTSKGFAVTPKSNIKLRSKMAAKLNMKDYQASVATVRFLVNKVQTLMGADAYLQPYMLENLQEGIRGVLSDRGLEKAFKQGLQKMQGDIGAALNFLNQTKEKDWKNRSTPGSVGVMARERIAEIQVNARHVLKQAINHGRETLKQPKQNRLARVFGQRSALMSAREKAKRVKYRVTRG